MAELGVRLNNSRPVDRNEVEQVVLVVAHCWPSRSFRHAALHVDAVVDRGPEDDVRVQVVAFRSARWPWLAPFEHRFMPGFQ